MRVGPEAKLALVACRAIEAGAPAVAVARRDLPTQVAEIGEWNGDFEDPALVAVGVVVERAGIRGGDLYALALPAWMNIFGPFAAATKGDIVE